MRESRFPYTALLLLTIALLFLPAAVSYAASPASDRQANELVIQFKEGTAQQDKQQIIRTVSGTEISTIEEGNFSLISLKAGTDSSSAEKNLLTHKEVLTAEENASAVRTYIPADPFYSTQWYLKSQNLPSAWDLPKGHAVIKVAIIDGGMQTNHPDLKGQIKSPYNVITGKKALPVSEHGTHIAGIIAALQNQIGTSGVAPEAKIIPVNVFDGQEADVFDIAKGIHYAIKANADIINMSLVTADHTKVLNNAIQAAAAKGIVIVAAAGNEHTSAARYPAAFKNVFAVSALTDQNKLADFSNYGKYIDFTAPGTDIFSTIPGGEYAYMSGTSMAAPMVSGISALILAKNPFLTPAQVQAILRNSAADLGAKGRDIKFGHGKVNAVQALKNTPDPFTAPSVSDPTLLIDQVNTESLSFTAPKGAAASLSIRDANGDTIRNICTKKNWTGGKITCSWDGRLDNGAYASTGKVTVAAVVSNSRHKLTKVKNLTVQNALLPNISLMDPSYLYSPAAADKLPIKFRLNKDAIITAAILDSSGNTVRTLKRKAAFPGGPGTMNWNGKDSDGNTVPDGTYQLRLSVQDADGASGQTKTAGLTIDTQAPKGTAAVSGSTFQKKDLSTLKAILKVQEPVTASVSIQNSKGTSIRQLNTSLAVKAGSRTFAWDGKNSKKAAVPAGKYRCTIEIKDAAGNKRLLSTKWFTIQ